MPYNVTVSSIIEARLIMEYQGERCMNVLHYRPQMDPTGGTNGPLFLAATAAVLSDVAAGSLLARYRAATHEELSFVRWEVQHLEPTRYAKVVQSIGTFGLIDTGVGAPSNLSADIIRRTEDTRSKVLGRHVGGTGTLHIPGIPISTLEENQLAPAYVSGPLTVLASGLVAPLVVNGSNLRPVIWHRTAPPGFRSSEVTSAEAQKEVRTMRRRGRGLGI